VSTVLAYATIFIAAPLNWIVVIRLWRLSRENPDLRVLRERAIVALALALLITVFSLVFLNNDLIPPLLAFEDTKIITRTVMLLTGVVPATYWLYLYR
jgi:hypothetical protein